MPHSHKPKVTDWGMNELHNWIPILYGCTECDDTFVEIPKEEEAPAHNHTEYTDGCFACKVVTLEMGTGDAGRADSMPQKKWDKELDFYRSTHSQGIQPAGTSTKQIRDALKASDNLGRAYSAETMIPAENVTKYKAKLMNEIGA